MRRFFACALIGAVGTLTLSPAAAGSPAFGALEGMKSPEALSATQNALPFASISRYKKTLMAAYTEYYPSTCKQISTGSWTVTLQPKSGVVTTGTISGKLASGDCPGQTFTFAAIYYEWTQHNNKTAKDVFDATWKTPDGVFNFPFVFNIQVPIVRPIGETSTFTGWADTRANWMQTLTPPTDDPSFDFSGESIREVYKGNNSTCINKTGQGSMGSTPNSTEATWTVGSGNKWGPDQVGWGPCAVEFYRCVKATPCGYTLQQEMQIKSSAEGDTYSTYTTNNLGASMDGYILPKLPLVTYTRAGVGGVTSKRGTAGQQSKGWVSHSTDCPASASLPC